MTLDDIHCCLCLHLCIVSRTSYVVVVIGPLDGIDTYLFVSGTSYVVVVIGPLDGIDIYVSLTGHHMLSSLSDH